MVLGATTDAELLAGAVVDVVLDVDEPEPLPLDPHAAADGTRSNAAAATHVTARCR
jgi:hypothetical protein